MNPHFPNIPVTLWQVFSIFMLIAAVPVGFYVRGLRIEKVKRREMLQKLHEEGEVEVIRPDFGLLEIMDDFSIWLMIRKLVQEGIISEHTRKVMRANRWEMWQVYQLTDPKGVKLATDLFGSPPKSPPE